MSKYAILLKILLGEKGMHEKSREVARLLISIQAVVVTPKKPFTYTSGLQGPIYCDNRKVLSHVTVRDKIIQ